MNSTADLSNNALIVLWCGYWFVPPFVDDILTYEYDMSRRDQVAAFEELDARGLTIGTHSHPFMDDYRFELTDAGAAIAAKYSEAEIEALAGVAE